MLVDGVFSGGGMKALAIIGALQVVEERGIRFKRVAGTSAGAIIASFIAAGYSSEEILELLEQVDKKQLLDTPNVSFPFFRWISIYWRLGLFKGDGLEKWIKEQLAKKGIKTFSDLPKGMLKIIASDLTRGKMIVFPDDLNRYGRDMDNFSVARAVRMSCTIPYFYEPIKLYDTRGNQSIIVDGGVLSNFPIWLFQSNGKGQRPIIGFRLSSNPEKKKNYNKIKNAIEMFHAIFDTMKDAHDARFVEKTDARQIIFLPVDTVSTTDFNLDEDKKQALLELGRQRAKKFFKKWSC